MSGQGYSLQRWRGPRGVRVRVLQRDGYRCQLELPGCTGRATTVHLSPLLGGDHSRATMDTCVSACHRCHGRVDGGRSRGGRGPYAKHKRPKRPLARIAAAEWKVGLDRRRAEAAAEREEREVASRRRRHASTISSHSRAEVAARLRLSGLTWREVAEQAGYASTGAAYNAVHGHRQSHVRGLDLVGGRFSRGRPAIPAEVAARSDRLDTHTEQAPPNQFLTAVGRRRR